MIPRLHAKTLPGAVRPIQLSEPKIFADNESKHRSGHVGHAMTEFAPGKIMAFSANTSPVRLQGHSGFGWVEYSISEDYGETFGAPRVLPFAWDTFLLGKNTVAVEKAVTLDNGEIVAFCLMNRQTAEVCCEPWDAPKAVISADQGETWSQPIDVTGYEGRIYDVLTHNGAVYVLEFCNNAETFFCGTQPDHLYRLFKSTDNCRTFQEVCVVPFASTLDRGYGNMILNHKGELIVYAYNCKDETHMDYILSPDFGETWTQSGTCFVQKQIRNPQVGILDGQYILHGRAGGGAPYEAFVLYTSADGILWDAGEYLVKYRPASFYSENLTLKLPDGREKMLVKYSENYDEAPPEVWSGRVNSMMLTITSL